MESRRVLLMTKREYADFIGRAPSIVTELTKTGETPGKLADAVVNGKIDIMHDAARTYAAVMIIQQKLEIPG